MILQLDDWVLCRIYNKKGTLEKHYNVDEKEVQFSDSEEQKPKVEPQIYTTTAMVAPQPSQSFASQGMNDYMHFDTSESVPKWQQTDSSSSEHVLSSEFICDKEVESHPKWSEIDSYLESQLNYMDGFQESLFNSQMQQQYNEQFPMFPDMYAYMQKPF